MKRNPLALAALIFAAPLSVLAASAQSYGTVSPTAGGFLVAHDREHGARGMWCSAASYARDALGAPASQRVFVASGDGAGFWSRDPVLFTIDPAGLVPAPVTIVGASLRRAGTNLTVGHALQFCADTRLPQH
ncbi:hypothetical protein SAMN04488523_10180 [Sulfitobacter brevis]|uniref:Uncharacterized protein n=1 Tax=Sulfitobacter brevis TaxID=74348 RepID=A0A1I1SRE1_9RHOB|nr:hypothetical protein [Sulfitobacter brevis]SFD47308.1 hypothetical protein SAMN04488523_10180 [Sulfitobacter brevis]